MDYIFFGNPFVAAETLSGLIKNNLIPKYVVTSPDAPSGRRLTLTPPPVKIIAQKYDIPVLQPDSLKNPEFSERLKSIGANFFLVIAYGAIIPKHILSYTAKGAINVHYSLLPKYRGASPVQSAILNGDTETGVSTILMNEKMDAGSILLNQKVQIFQHEDRISLFSRLIPIGENLAIRSMKEFEKITPSPQSEIDASYCGKFTKAISIIDWSKPALIIFRIFLAFRGELPLKAHSKGNNFVIEKMLPLEGLFHGEPGQLQIIERKRLVVTCGENSGIEILEIRPAGKKTQSSSEFINGYMNNGNFRFD